MTRPTITGACAPLLVALLVAAGCAQVTDAFPYRDWVAPSDDDDATDDDDSTGVDDDDSTGGDDDDAIGPCDDSFLAVSEEAVSFSSDIVALFATACGPCHIIQTRGNMTLTEFKAYNQIVGVPNSLEFEDLARVEPGDPVASYLMHKIMPCLPTHETWGYLQGPMPPPFPGVEPLTNDEINLIYSWISQGALDN